MNKKLNDLSEIIARANDVFFSLHKSHDTLMGIMDKTLRQQGMKADAITIDCVALDKKIVFVLHDEKPDMVDVALGNKHGDIFSSTEYELININESVVVSILEDNFLAE